MRKKKGKGQASSTRYPRDEQRRRVERWPCPIIGLEKPGVRSQARREGEDIIYRQGDRSDHVEYGVRSRQ